MNPLMLFRPRALDELVPELQADDVDDDSRLQFVPPALDDNEWERRQVGDVHFRPLLWTTTPPTKAGYWWVRFPGGSEPEVVRIEDGFEYGPGLEWSSAPVLVPRG